jgi:rare lipoprotein A
MRQDISKVMAAVVLCAGVSFASDGEPTFRRSTKVIAAKPAKTSAKVPKIQVGRASWYGKAFHGRLTANGETYDMFQFTAAHRTLPLGTMLKVTNLRNGKWVIVRINDRGPYVGNRIVDLSYGAAQMLNLRAKGVEKVKLEILEPTTVAMVDSLTGLD